MPNSTINSIKNAFAHFSASDILAGFKDIGSIAGQLISSGLFVINILSVLNNKKLKPTQKILPLIGYSLAIIASTAVAIILIAGMTALIPPFIFTASCVAVFNGMTTYLEARAERNVLRKELISSLSFQEYVAKKIPLKHHPDVLKYSYLPQEIYKLFYELRDKINQLDIPLLEKKEFILNLYTNMAAFSEDTTTNISFSIPELSDSIALLNTRLTEYQGAKNKILTLNLKKSTLSQINAFKITGEKIWCQDLPAVMKERLTELIESKKKPKRDIANLYLRMGNHYVNRHTLEQLQVQDNQLTIVLVKAKFNEAEIKTIMAYLTQPREIYDCLLSIQHLLEKTLESEQEKQKIQQHLRDYLNFPNSKNVNSLLAILQESPAKDVSLFNEFKERAEKYQTVSDNYEQLTKTKKNDLPVLKTIENHHLQGLNQYSNCQQNFPDTPKISIPTKEHDLLTKAGKSLKNKTEKNAALFLKKSISTLPKKGTLKHEFKEDIRYTLELIAAKENLNFLEKATPRCALNILFSAGLAVISLASTIILPLIATYNVVAVTAAATALTVCTAILTTTNVANNIAMTRINLKQQIKVYQTKKDITDAITPTLEPYHKKHLGLIDKLRSKLQSNSRPEDKKNNITRPTKKMYLTSMTKEKSTYNQANQTNPANENRQRPSKKN